MDPRGGAGGVRTPSKKFWGGAWGGATWTNLSPNCLKMVQNQAFFYLILLNFRLRRAKFNEYLNFSVKYQLGRPQFCNK